MTSLNQESAVTPLRVLIVDDEPPARAGLRGLPLPPPTPAGVALVDTHMPGMSGIEFARHLQLLEVPPAVIFVTAHDRYAVEAFEVNAVDYLLKPVRSGRIAAALKKAAAGPRRGRGGVDRGGPDPRGR